jgi:hypothetical protein
MVERVYNRSTTQGNQMGGPYQRLSTNVNGKMRPKYIVFILKVRNTKGDEIRGRKPITLSLSNVAIMLIYVP